MQVFSIRYRLWVTTDSEYYALLAQGYVTHQIQKRQRRHLAIDGAVMSRNDRKIKGAIYSPYRQIEQTRAEWQRLMGAAIDAGGRRRAEGGETFIHMADGWLLAEIYEIVPAADRSGRAAQTDDDALAGEEAA